jgi:hypothetical protein
MPTIIEHFDALTARGLKIIPLRENSKVPLCKGWTEHWDKGRAREKLTQFPDANLGILLGDIIDVEGDSDEANRTIIDLIGDYPHPSYQSTKSIHHLFVTPDFALRHFRYADIEFRGYGHQSVIPPSQHQGTVYRWLKQFRFPVPPMPNKLLQFYKSKQERSQRTLKPHHIRVWCGSCRAECMLHGKRFDLELEAFRLFDSKWECQKCRTLDLRPACRLLRAGVKGKVISSSSFSSHASS